MNFRCMELLDEANTGTFGTPQPAKVPTDIKKGPFIVVSGHDLGDLAQLLEQTAGKGIRWNGMWDSLRMHYEHDWRT